MTNIVVPVKNPSAAKQRLAAVLNSDQRKRLALLLVDHVLQTLIPFRNRCGILVVTDSLEIIERVSGLDVQTLLEPESKGETAAVRLATDWSCKRGFDRQIVIPGDLPCLTPEDVEKLLDVPFESPSVTLCPATGDDGTNAIVTAPPDVLTFRFGARSFPDYRTQADQKKIPCRILRLKSLVLDLDTPEDLKQFLTLDTDLETHRILASWLPKLAAVGGAA